MLWTATYVLMGLKYPSAFTEQLLRGVRQMKESVTYQAILAEGVRDVIANRFSVEPLPYETRTLQTLGARILWRIVSP